MKHSLYILLMVLLLASAGSAKAQRKISPVKIANKEMQGVNENKSDSIDLSQFKRITDANGNVVLVDTITGTEVPDSIIAANTKSTIPPMIQPLLYAAAVGVDVWDPLMRLFGQHYGLVEFSGELNLHNRYIPVVEVGLGQASYTPDNNNYTYRVPVTPYFRLGCNYNFIYNSNPDYMAYAGVRFGWSRFSYSVDDVTLDNSYWGEDITFNVPSQTASLTYMQVLFGIRVKIAGPISLGWNFRYRARLHESKATYGNPWYIPGFGSRNGHISGSFSITYTLPLRRKAKPENFEFDLSNPSPDSETH